MITTNQIVFDGPRKAVIRITGAGDGVPETNVVKVDLTTLFPKPKRLRIDRLYGTTGGGAVQVKWDGINPLIFAEVDGIYDLDFTEYGGFTADKTAGGILNGNISITTLGFDVNSTYDITFVLVKKYK